MRAATHIPVPEQAERVLLVGGSFDPPTLAHVRLADAARNSELGSDAWLVFVPAARSPHKQTGPGASDAQRVEMLTIATSRLSNAPVWTDELERAGESEASYWVDTLERAHAQRPDLSFWFLIGSDQAGEFYRWHAPDRILELAEPLVVLREPLDSPAVLLETMASTGSWSDDQMERWGSAVLELPCMPHSSTQARAVCAEPEPDHAALVALLGEPVAAYVLSNGLYRPEPAT